MPTIVYPNCSCCSSSSSSSSSRSSSSIQPGACCADSPDILFADISGSAEMVVPLPRGGPQSWAANFTFCGHFLQLFVTCAGGVYSLFINNPDGCAAFIIGTSSAVSASCSPFELEFPGRNSIDICGSCGASLTIIVRVTA